MECLVFFFNLYNAVFDPTFPQSSQYLCNDSKSPHRFSILNPYVVNDGSKNPLLQKIIPLRLFGDKTWPLTSQVSTPTLKSQFYSNFFTLNNTKTSFRQQKFIIIPTRDHNNQHKKKFSPTTNPHNNNSCFVKSHQQEVVSFTNQIFSSAVAGTIENPQASCRVVEEKKS